jgi:hypothetical protein
VFTNRNATPQLPNYRQVNVGSSGSENMACNKSLFMNVGDVRQEAFIN